MNKRLMTSIGVAALSAVVLTGCGASGGKPAVSNQSSNASTNSSASNASATAKNSITTKNGTVIINGKQYSGAATLKKYQTAAKNKPSDFQAQIQAGIASHVNGDDAAAIKYYKAAGKVNPKSAIPFNNIGNIYLRDKQDAKSAIPYYQKATKADPTYGYGWWNLSIAEAGVGNTAAAKKAVASGLKNVKKSDPAYPGLQAMQKKLNNPGGSNRTNNATSSAGSNSTKK